MKVIDHTRSVFRTPFLTRKRMAFALLVALATDAIQLGLGPIGWSFLDEAMDVLAMALTCLALGFHPLLLPTFIIEVIPIIDMLPTWTGCVMAVILLRRKAQTPPRAPVHFETTVSSSPAPEPVPPSRQLK